MAYITRSDGLPPIPPLRWTDPDAMQARVDQYFAQCAEREEPATVTGLALALDFVNRAGLLRYESGEVGELTLDERTRRDLQYTVKRAKARIEAQREVALYQGKVNPIGTIFSLKNNFGWIDKVEHAGGSGITVNLMLDQSPSPQVSISNVVDQQGVLDVSPVAQSDDLVPISITTSE